MYRSIALGACVLLIAVGCSSEKNGHVDRGELEQVWAIQDEVPIDEPWFGRIFDIEVWQNRIFISDRIRREVLVLDTDGSFIYKIGNTGRGPGEFNIPGTITMSPSGSFFLSSGQLLEYTHDGQFIQRIILTELFEDADFYLGPSVAISDTELVFDCTPRGRPATVEEETSFPMAVYHDGKHWKSLGNIQYPEDAEATRLSLKPDARANYIRAFTKGDLCRGEQPDEVFFIRNCDPYTVFRLSPARPRTSFRYKEIPGREWVMVHSGLTPEEKEDRRAKYFADFHINLVNGKPVNDYFTYSHAQRGMVTYNNSLFILAVVLNPEAQDGIADKWLYMVNLDTEELEMEIPVNIPGQVWLMEVTNTGQFLFAVENPIPGLLAYRLIN